MPVSLAPHAGPAARVRLTAHAARRASQRSLSGAVLDLLLDLGDRVPSGGGAELVHFGRVSRAAAAAQLGRTAFAAIERKLTTAYAILAADGAVITVGHRTRRLPRR